MGASARITFLIFFVTAATAVPTGKSRQAFHIFGEFNITFITLINIS